jgi:hypothetical protein
MCGNLCRFLSIAAGSIKILTYLLAARTGCVEVLLGVALDLRGAASSSGDFVAELAKPVGQLRLVDGSSELLRLKESALLKCAELATTNLALGSGGLFPPMRAKV